MVKIYMIYTAISGEDVRYFIYLIISTLFIISKRTKSLQDLRFKHENMKTYKNEPNCSKKSDLVANANIRKLNNWFKERGYPEDMINYWGTPSD